MARYCKWKSFDNREVTFEFGKNFVTGHSAVIPIAQFARRHPLVRAVSRQVAGITGRTYNPFNHYTDQDLFIQSILSSIHRMGRPEDSLITRFDPAFEYALRDVASPSTISRWLNTIGSECLGDRNPEHISELDKSDPVRIGSEEIDRINSELLSYCLSKIGSEEKILIDADSTFIETFGRQNGSAFCGKNRANGYFPLLVFINGHIAHIQNAPGATDGRALLEQCIDPILSKIRERFPDSPILLRADGGFNSDNLLNKCDEYKAGFLSGFAPNSSLNQQALLELARNFAEHRKGDLIERLSLQLINELFFTTELGSSVDSEIKPDGISRVCMRVKGYRAKSWKKPRNIYLRLLESADYKEVDLRFIQTNMSVQEILFWCDGQGVKKQMTLPENCPTDEKLANLAIDLYDGLYCQRATCELLIREFKAILSEESLSCANFFANWFKLMMAAVSCHVMEDLRLKAFQKHPLLKCGIKTLFKTILSIPARIIEKNGKIIVLLNRLHSDWYEAFLKLITACT